MINKYPKFDNNFNIWCQLEHFEYEMNMKWVYECKPKTFSTSTDSKVQKVLAHPYNFQMEF